VNYGAQDVVDYSLHNKTIMLSLCGTTLGGDIPVFDRYRHAPWGPSAGAVSSRAVKVFIALTMLARSVAGTVTPPVVAAVLAGVPVVGCCTGSGVASTWAAGRAEVEA
jgi:hypothetical protein